MICRENQLTGFYMIAILTFIRLKKQGEIMTLTQSMLVTFVLLKKIRVHSTINKQEIC